MSDDGRDRAESLRRLFEEALDADGGQRAVLIAATEARDRDLARELRELLEANDTMGERFAGLDLSVAAQLLVDAEIDGNLVEEGARIGRFHVVRRLGQGGMGAAFLARDPELERLVALKVLTAYASAPKAQSDLLLREARATSKLDHPSIATIYDVGRMDDGRLFMAMAYYEGETLAERIRAGPVPPAEALSIIKEVGNALKAAHEAGIVHRDVKPTNVMLLTDGGVRVLDFGIAVRTDVSGLWPGAPVGTVRYMSPERLRGVPGDAPADIWALGVVLFEMVTGRRPFDAERDADVMAQIEQRTLERARLRELVPEAYVELIATCLEKDPVKRFPDADAFVEAVGSVESDIRASAPDVGFRKVAIGGTIAVAAGLAAFAFATHDTSPVHPAAAVLAVLPPIAPGEDTSLVRVGRELAVTVAMNLDGVGGIQVVDPLAVLGLAEVRDPAMTTEDRIDAVMSMGATAVVTGSLLSLDDHVQVDARLVSDIEAPPLGRSTITRPASDLAGLTDSLSWDLLGTLWQARSPPTPSIQGLTTRSFPALRAFLDGEQAIAEGRLREAPASFSAAIAADSTFWLAYWRLWWSRSWHGIPSPDGVREAVLEHLAELPPRDSALARARTVSSLAARYDLTRRVAEARPFDWLAWFEHQDLLVHDGGYLGIELEQARAAVERVVALDPGLTRGWDHLFWVVREQRDTLAMRQISDRLEALSYDSLTMAEGGVDDLVYMRIQTRVLREGGRLRDSDLELGLNLVAQLQGATAQRRFVSNLLSEGLSAAQLQMSDALLSGSASSSLRAAAQYGRSLALAARGRWTQALEAAADYAQAQGNLDGAVHGIQMAAVGAAIDGVVPGTATELAAGVDRHTDTDPAIAAEVAWLLGLDAFARGDPSAMSRRRRDLVATDSEAAPYLARSLGALELAVRGEVPEATAALTELVREGVEEGLYRRFTMHPYHHGVLRLLAARLVLAEGDATTAIPLLTWHEATLPDTEAWMVIRANRILQPLADLERAKAEATLGRTVQARRYHARALEHLDAPDRSLDTMIGEVSRMIGGGP